MPKGQYQRKPKGEPATTAEVAAAPEAVLTPEPPPAPPVPLAPVEETWTVMFASHEGGWVHRFTHKGRFKRPQTRCDFRGVMVPAMTVEVQAATEDDAVTKAIASMVPKVSR